MKLEPIDNWRKAYRMLSVQAAALLALVAAAYDHLPTLHAYLPDGWVKWAALAVIAARIIKQDKLNADAKN